VEQSRRFGADRKLQNATRVFRAYATGSSTDDCDCHVVRSRSERLAMPGLGQQSERCDVAGTHDPEVSMIQGGNLDDLQSFSQSNDRGVGSAKREIGVLLNQVGATVQILCREVSHFEKPCSKGTKKLSLYGRATITCEQETHLGNDQARHESWRAR
jgi:hypothetical protein